MRWSRALLLPHVLRWGMRAPREVSTRWDRYWAQVTATGDGGDVLWDSSSPDEARRYLDLLAAHVDVGLPIVDLGCGNGRFTRTLATRYPRALGLDLSPAAIARAQYETTGQHQAQQPDHPGQSPQGAGPEFRAEDMTTDGVGTRLHTELGDANVFIRGVLHVLDADARQQVCANIGALTGVNGSVLIVETNHPGSLLSYLESLGAGPRGLPHPVARAIASGLPTPRPFGVAELDSCFPPSSWDRVLVDDHAVITAVPMHHNELPEAIPALLAILRPRQRWPNLPRQARHHQGGEGGGLPTRGTVAYSPKRLPAP